ncbi:MAG: hypothetical protein QOJ65_205 [Fimbriimonadaceae bacterium]|nr:hypothetical protein [Fimbriimonadaceae bacterium]
MTTIEQEGLLKRSLRERRKSTVSGVVCLAMSATSFALIKLWLDLGKKGQAMPFAAYLALAGVGALYAIIGIQCLRKASKGVARTASDQTVATDIFWLASIFLFVTLTASGMAVGEPGASTPSIVGLALLVVGAVYKVIDHIKQAELRIRETVLERIVLASDDA